MCTLRHGSTRKVRHIAVKRNHSTRVQLRCKGIRISSTFILSAPRCDTRSGTMASTVNDTLASHVLRRVRLRPPCAGTPATDRPRGHAGAHHPIGGAAAGVRLGGARDPDRQEFREKGTVASAERTTNKSAGTCAHTLLVHPFAARQVFGNKNKAAFVKFQAPW